MIEPIDRSFTQIVEYANSAHELLNRELFDGKLSTPFIDFQNISYEIEPIYGVFIKDTSKYYGTFLAKEPCAILLSLELWDEVDSSKSLEEQNARIISTLLHEMIHQFCHENNIVDAKDGLHTENFLEVAETHGLMCFSKQEENGINYSITYLDPDWEDVWNELCADFDKCV